MDTSRLVIGCGCTSSSFVEEFNRELRATVRTCVDCGASVIEFSNDKNIGTPINDAKTLVVGQDAFLHGTGGAVWAKVIAVTHFGATVETEPCYGAELIQFDKSGNIIGRHSKLRLYLSPEEAGIVLRNIEHCII
jgi:hypothetical protein